MNTVLCLPKAIYWFKVYISNFIAGVVIVCVGS